MPHTKNHKAQITRLVRKHGTPLFTISKSRLKEQFNKFRALLPRVEPYYAVKANSCQGVLKAFMECGAGFDVASDEEIKILLALGAKPQRLLFANTIKRPSVLEFAASKGVNLMTFDSEYELNKIAKFAPGANVIVRIKVPNVGSAVELSIKFGVEPADAIGLLIKAHKLGLKPTGVSFHVGSQCTHIENYIEAFEMASIIVHDSRLKQVPLEVVDIGGGFPIRHFDDEQDLFNEMAPVLNRELDRLFDSKVRLIAEPGRALAGPGCTLFMSVIGKSIRMNKHWYYLDDGVYGCLSGIVFDHCKYQYNVLRNGPTQISTLAGPTCDSLDIISYTEEFPELEIGDVVYVENIGAYSIASATNFNSIPQAKVVTVS